MPTLDTQNAHAGGRVPTQEVRALTPEAAPKTFSVGMPPI